MNKQKIMLWLFPEQTDKQELDYDHISNKKFLFMTITATATIILSKLLLE